MNCPQRQHENPDESAEPPIAAYRTRAGNEPPPLPRGGFGDIIDSSFSVYASHFLPFILIAVFPQIPLLLGGTMVADTITISLWSSIGALLSFVVGILAGGAMIQAVGRHYLGSPVLVGHSYVYAWARFPKLIGALGVVLLILIILALLSVFLIGIPLLIFTIVALLFVNHAVVIEQHGPIDAVKRSWNVVWGNWWRTFGIFAGVMLALFGATVIVVRASVFFLSDFGTFGLYLFVLLSTSFSVLTTPLITIAVTVLYLNIRVRKEQYTHADLAREMGELPATEDTSGPQYERKG